MNRERPKEGNRPSAREIYQECRAEICIRLNEFCSLLEREGAERLFAEMAFCLFTPQSNARSCWEAVQRLCSRKLLWKGAPSLVSRHLKGVRFHHTKALRLVQARERFPLFLKKLKGNTGPRDLREWLVINVPGLGYKEASHFLRNIGLGDDMAILDRHILRNLQAFGIIRSIPHSLTRKRYLEIEEKMKAWSREIQVPLSHLDLVLWFKEKKEVFK